MARKRTPTTRGHVKIAAWLRRSRLEYWDGDGKVGLTQEQLAERSGVCVTTISEIERALKRPSQLTLVRLATALGKEVDEIGAIPRHK